MRSGRGSSTLICTKMTHQCGRKRRVVLKVPGEEIDRRINRTAKVFARMDHGVLVSESSNLELL